MHRNEAAEYTGAKLSRTAMEKLLIETSSFHRLLFVSFLTRDVVLLLFTFYPKTPERGSSNFTMQQTAPQYSRSSAVNLRLQ